MAQPLPGTKAAETKDLGSGLQMIQVKNEHVYGQVVTTAMIGEGLPVEAFGIHKRLVTAALPGVGGNYTVVDSMTTHPIGLLIVRGEKRYLLPYSKLQFIELA